MYGNSRQNPQFKTLIYEQELDRIAGWVEEYPNLETGGDLFGFWTHSGGPVIQFVLGPGPNSQHNPTSFYQEKEFLIKAGEFLRTRHGLQHIGEWHSHHQMGLAQPSSGDCRTVLRALETYEFPRFLLCIANLRNASQPTYGGDWTVNIGSFLFHRSRTTYENGQWVVLPGESPIRSESKARGFNQKAKFLQEINLQQKKSWKVYQTSLDAQVLEPTQKIEISKGLWYADSKGQEFLKAIYTKMVGRFSNCQMRRNTSDQIYFTFEEKQHMWQLDFPDNFPASMLALQKNGRSIAKIQYTNPLELIKKIEFYIKYPSDIIRGSY